LHFCGRNIFFPRRELPAMSKRIHNHCDAITEKLVFEIVLDMVYGALFFRLLMGHAALDEALVRQLLDEALRGLRCQA
jgi:hypothetical protein